MENLNSSSDSSTPSNGWPTDSLPKANSTSRARPNSARPRTPAKAANLKSGKKGPRNRRSELLNRLGVDAAQVSIHPQISPLLKQCGIEVKRLVEVLQSDMDPDSMKFVQLWESLKPPNRSLIGLEALALACGMTPRRLWELYCGATMIQSREFLGVQIAEALPHIMRVTIRDAKKVKGYASREHIYKAARVLPTPKGTVINLPGSPAQAQLPEGSPGDASNSEDGGMVLGSADDFMVRASKAMNTKALAAPPPVVVAELDEEEEGDE